MKIELRTLVRPMHLREYAPEYGDEVIWVWVNPPRRLRLDYWRLGEEFGTVIDQRRQVMAEPEPDAAALASLDGQVEELGRQIYGFFAEIWSQHEDEETHWTADDVGELVEACLDADPHFWDWIQEETWRLIREHREGVQKN